jgi:hypothetical protein
MGAAAAIFLFGSFCEFVGGFGLMSLAGKRFSVWS